VEGSPDFASGEVRGRKSAQDTERTLDSKNEKNSQCTMRSTFDISKCSDDSDYHEGYMLKRDVDPVNISFGGEQSL
jgi:hypothetical protein